MQKVSGFLDNVSFPWSQSRPQLMTFFGTSMLFSVQRAPGGWKQRSPQEHQRTHSAFASSVLTCGDPIFLNPHLSLSHCSCRTHWPQLISPGTLVIFNYISCCVLKASKRQLDVFPTRMEWNQLLWEWLPGSPLNDVGSVETPLARASCITCKMKIHVPWIKNY